MKILQINATYGIGSTGTIVRDIQKSCYDSGLECYVAYSLAEGDVPNGYKIGNWLSNKIHALLSRLSGKQGYFSYLPTLFFIRYLNELQPDIVHLHNLHSNYVNLPILLRYLAKHDIRTIITLHDCWWYTGGCFHYTQIGCKKWMHGCGNCPKKHEDMQSYIIDSSKTVLRDRRKLLLKIPRLSIIGVSDWISNEARRSLLKGLHTKTIHNGIDVNVFKYSSSDFRCRLGLEDKFIILGPATKWLMDVNRPILEYISKNMDSDEVLLLFGVSTKIPLPSNIILYGYTKDRFELAALYSAADVFVNVSREDSLSLINLESQSCGTPVITFDETGPKETVNNQTSFSVSPKEYHKILDYVRFIKDNRLPKEQVRRFIYENFRSDINSQKYVELYLNSL